MPTLDFQYVTPEVEALRWKRALALVGVLALLCAVLWAGLLKVNLSVSTYLVLHTALEVASIAVSMLGFGIAWHAYSHERPGSIIVLGVVLFGAGLLDFGHTLSYEGMPDMVTPSSPGKAIGFWLAARLLMAVGLLAVALQGWVAPRRASVRYWWMGGVCAYTVLVYWLMLGRPDLVPDFFVPGQGLTPLKVRIEYLLVLIYGVAAALFFRRQRQRRAQSQDAELLNIDLFAAAAITGLSELFFAHYAQVTDLVNGTGHLYKIFSYCFLYRAVFVRSVRQPFEALAVALDKEKVRAAEHHAFVRTLDLLEEAVVELDPQGHIVSANSGWWQLIGMESRSGVKLADYLQDDDRQAFSLHLHGLMADQKDEFRGRYRFKTPTQSERWLECRFVVERGQGDAIVGARGVLRDITKSYLQERHIAHMAMHDALTGLPNRVLLEDRLKQAIQQAARKGNRVGVCFIDLDHFKNINDAYGHKTGDALLVNLAQLLKSCLREGDTLARWGGDEFVVLLPDLPHPDAARQVAQKMAQIMRRTVMLDEVSVNVTFSMGIAVYPDDESAGGIDNLLAQADRAMFYAKSQGRDNFQLFADMSSKGLGKKELYISRPSSPRPYASGASRSGFNRWCVSCPKAREGARVCMAWRRWRAGTTRSWAGSRRAVSFPWRKTWG
jgi:diguanylate cyclase (GGDEF)-like protein